MKVQVALGRALWGARKALFEPLVMARSCPGQVAKRARLGRSLSLQLSREQCQAHVSRQPLAGERGLLA